ncbi:non-homologous end joining protein Ku [Tomitella biformata]|nr:Ku protein [Tomitella biformata]
MRSTWNGQVSFGLVSIPVRLYSATESKNIAFHQVHERDGGQIKYKRVCEVDGEEVPYPEIAKGYETDDGQLVVLTDRDLAAVPAPAAKTAEVLEFVPLEAIDPIYFDKTYYVEPQKAGIKPYLLLRDALQKSGRVAIAKIALRQRESLAVLRVYSDVLMISTMLWPDEVRAADFPFLGEDHPQIRPQEMTMAATLIEGMSDDVFDPAKYHDTYRAALTEMVEAKIAGHESIAVPAAAGADEEVADLLAALSASVEQAQRPHSNSGPS